MGCLFCHLLMDNFSKVPITNTKYYWLLEMEKQFFIIEPKCDFCDDLGHTEDECPKRPKCDYCDERG